MISHGGGEGFEEELARHRQNLLNCVSALEVHAKGLKQAEESLGESEHSLRALLENAAQGIITIDADGGIVQANGMAVRMFGYTSDELLGQPVEVLLPDALRHAHGKHREQYFRAPLDRAMGAGLDLMGRRKDGTEFPIEVNLSRIPTSRGQLAISFITDISDRRHSEEQARLQAALLAQTHEPILIWQIGGAIRYWNHGAEKLYGFTAAEAIGREKHELLLTRGGVEHDEIVAALSAEGTWRGERTHTTKDGREINVESQMTTLRKGQALMVLETDRDISQRLRMERELRSSEERLRRALDAAEIGTWDYDPLNGSFTGDERAKSIFGISLDVTVDFDVWISHVFPDDRDSVRESVRAALDPAGLGKFVTEFRTVPAIEGAPRAVYAQGKAYFDTGSNRRAVRFITTVQDITLRKRLDDQLRQSQRLESIGKLAGGVAHDFNNMLTVMSGYAGMVMEELTPEHHFYESIQEISKAAARATKMTSQLLAFSRRQTREMCGVELNTVVLEVEKMLRRLIGEHIELELSLGSELCRIRADPGQIEQVIVNLVVNARDAMPQGGRLSIETTNLFVDREFASANLSLHPGSYVSLSVSDTGIGMTPDVKAHIFEPFFTTKEQGAGTGLGLSTVYGIVEQSRGAISVHSQPGQGSTFRLLFPIADGEIIAPVTWPLDPPPRRTGTVLLVEDEDGVRKFIRRILERHGYTVIEASNGIDALARAAERGEPVDLLLTDVVMPKMGGPELAREFQATYPDVPILQMSGYTDRFKHHTEVAGGYIQKPFHPSVLLGRIEALLSSLSSSETAPPETASPEA